jgi:putative ABC transport system substrate-binding protein
MDQVAPTCSAELVKRGGKPSDIPGEQPTNSSWSSISRTAKALGLTIPGKLLALADEVIE